MNPKTPPGGFQQGGWYSGRQYWGGTFSEPGQIHPGSSQSGAGQAVSKEVIAQTAPQNVAYIEQQRQTAGLAPSPTAGAPASSGFSQAGTTGQAGAGAGFTPPATFDPVVSYDALYKSSGITDKQAQFSGMEKQHIEAKGKINDNPFLSEATRVGRVAKLEQLFGERTANIKSDIATSKADVEMKLNLELKRFDINSQVAKTAFDQVNNLISSGAFDNASGDDIANATRSSGISSSMIYSAINAQKAKNVKTDTIKWDDNINQGFAVVNSQTGEIINKQTIAATSTKPEKAEGSGTGLLNEQRQIALDKAQAPQAARQAATKGKTLSDMMSFYSQWMSKQQIYDIYSAVNYYKATTARKKADKKRYGIK